MSAPRRFDWDEARRLRGDGVTYTAIAARFGVSNRAVRLACDDRARARATMLNANWQRQGSCPDCGAQTTRHRADGDRRCYECAGLARTTSARADDLLCFTCREWKPDVEFPHNRAARKARRGRHNNCRVCQTVTRRAYRERLKVPCKACGSPCLPANEKGVRGKDTGLCATCWQTRKRAAA